MIENKDKNLNEDFEGYENARVDKEDEAPKIVSDKEVEAANVLLNPDENTRDRG